VIRVAVDVHRQRPPIEELQPAPAAVKQAAFTGDAFQQVQKPTVLPVDLVGLFQTGYPESATQRAAAGWTQVVTEAARDELFAFAATAFVNRHIAETLNERPVNSPELSTALPALHPRTFITQFAERAQAARQ
jgi:hypothetical protein